MSDSIFSSSKNVPHAIPIAVADGDGIGPELMEVVKDVLVASGAPLEFRPVEMGKRAYLRGISSGMPPETQEIVERAGVLLKGPMETPKGGGMKSINVTARKLWSTFANKRVFQSLPNVETLHSRAHIPVHITMVRENIEDTYGGIEHMQTHDVAQCRRLITRPGAMKVHRYAFEVASRKGAKRITCGHKANIMKLTDGLFLEAFYEVARGYPGLRADDLIVDDLAMKLVQRPNEFDVIVLPNLQGDILSDLCAGLVGGLAYAPSANIGERVAIFEAVHGTAPDIAGKGIANPTALLLSATMMLRHVGCLDHADRVEEALLRTLADVSRPFDLAMPRPAPTTTTYRDLITAHLEHIIREKPIEPLPPLMASTPTRVDARRPIETPKREAESVVGVDLFVESNDVPDRVAAAIAPLVVEPLALTMISNRGTQVWPTGSTLTECVNHYRVRIESKDGAAIPEPRLFSLASAVSERMRVCSLEVLMRFGDRRGYSLAQGQ